MKKLLLVVVLVVFGLMAGCASMKTETKAAPAYTFVVLKTAPFEVPVAGGQKVTFNAYDVMKTALTAEYKSFAGGVAVIEGTAGQAGAITIEPRKIDLWTRSALVKEGVVAAYVNGKWVAGYYGELEGAISAQDAKTKIEAAAAQFAQKVRFEIAP